MASDPIFDVFRQYRQVIVWGFPLHSHTHSYIHGAWVKTFQYLGVPVHWFHDDDFPSPDVFDYTSTCFITEGWADNQIPVEATSTYFVHIARCPAKYLDKGARLIEIRYHVVEINDFNYEYTLPSNPIYVSKDTLYERVPDDRAVAKKRGRAVDPRPYEVIYMHWATDLLPHEFHYEDAAAEHERVIHYLGTVSQGHPFLEFKQYAEQAGLCVVHNDPWAAPVSYEENKERMKRSYCCPDFRSHGDHDKYVQYGKMNGSNHVDIGYVPCRVLKAISYGHTGITNSPRVKEILGEHVEYAATPAEVLPIVEARKQDITWRQAAMKHIAEHHTYLQRVRDLARVLSFKQTPMTVVTALYDIGREKVDGRDMTEYIEWLKQTLRILRDPVVLFLDPALHPSVRSDVLSIRSSIGPLQLYDIPFHQLPMWKYRTHVAYIHSLPAFQQSLKYPMDITNHLPEYSLLQYSKFDFLEQTICENPYHSALFCWMDAGVSRFLSQEIKAKPTAFEAKPTANNFSVHRFAVQTSYEQIPLPLSADTYIGSNECILKGTVLCTGPETFHEVKARVMNLWQYEMMDKNRMDNEQIALALVYQESPSRFELCIGKGQCNAIIARFFDQRHI